MGDRLGIVGDRLGLRHEELRVPQLEGSAGATRASLERSASDIGSFLGNALSIHHAVLGIYVESLISVDFAGFGGPKTIENYRFFI